MRRRAGAHTPPLGALEVLLARCPGWRQWDSPFGREITRERWLQHGHTVMDEIAERVRAGAPDAHRVAWPWLLYGDPAGWTSAPGVRWLAVLDEIAWVERSVAAGNHRDLSGYLAALTEALSTLPEGSPP